MSTIDDNYKNAVMGTLVSVDNRSWTDDGSSMVVIRCNDPFNTVFVREFITNYADAEMLIDRTVVLYDRRVHQLVHTGVTGFTHISL